MIKAFALLAIALVPGSALALEKCVDASGKISYVDRCPAGTQRAPSTTDERIIPKVPPKPVITRPELEPVPGALKPVPIPSQSPVEAAAPPKPAPAPGAAPAPAPAAAPAPSATPAPAAAAAAAAPAPAVTAATLPGDVKVEFYDVQGADQAALMQALNAHGGGHAKSAWKLSYQYQPRREKGQCGVGPVSTRLELAMTLPRWTPPADAPADLLARWRKYVDALAAKENGRLDKAREMERALKPVLQGLPLAADCNALDAAVVARYEALQQQVRSEAEADAGNPVFE